MNRRILLDMAIGLLMLSVLAGFALAKLDTSQVAAVPSGSGDLTVGQIIALTVSTAVALIGLWLFFRPKNRDEKISKTAITPRRF